jgi:hypothetical protein
VRVDFPLGDVVCRARFEGPSLVDVNVG